MSLKDKMKELLFEQDANSKQQSTAQPTVQVATQSQPIQSSEPSVQSTIEVDEKLLDVIEQKIKEANIPGPDYLELKEAAEEKSYVADESDEGKRWRQSYRNMKAYFPQAGITKKKLLSAIDHYIGIVRNEIQIGQNELKTLMDRDVVQAKASIATLDSDIAKLEASLQEMKVERENRLQKIQECQSKYEHREQIFNHTTSFVIKMLEGDKEKINNYITE